MDYDDRCRREAQLFEIPFIFYTSSISTCSLHRDSVSFQPRRPANTTSCLKSRSPCQTPDHLPTLQPRAGPLPPCQSPSPSRLFHIRLSPQQMDSSCSIASKQDKSCCDTLFGIVCDMMRAIVTSTLRPTAQKKIKVG